MHGHPQYMGQISVIPMYWGAWSACVHIGALLFLSSKELHALGNVLLAVHICIIVLITMDMFNGEMVYIYTMLP